MSDLEAAREGLRRFAHRARRARGTYLDPDVAFALIVEAAEIAEAALDQMTKLEAQVVAMGILAKGEANVSRETRDTARTGIRAGERIANLFKTAREVIVWAEKVRELFQSRDREKWAATVVTLKMFDDAMARHKAAISGEEKRAGIEVKNQGGADA